MTSREVAPLSDEERDALRRFTQDWTPEEREEIHKFIKNWMAGSRVVKIIFHITLAIGSLTLAISQGIKFFSGTISHN